MHHGSDGDRHLGAGAPVRDHVWHAPSCHRTALRRLHHYLARSSCAPRHLPPTLWRLHDRARVSVCCRCDADVRAQGYSSTPASASASTPAPATAARTMARSSSYRVRRHVMHGIELDEVCVCVVGAAGMSR